MKTVFEVSTREEILVLRSDDMYTTSSLLRSLADPRPIDHLTAPLISKLVNSIPAPTVQRFADAEAAVAAFDAVKAECRTDVVMAPKGFYGDNMDDNLAFCSIATLEEIVLDDAGNSVETRRHEDFASPYVNFPRLEKEYRRLDRCAWENPNDDYIAYIDFADDISDKSVCRTDTIGYMRYLAASGQIVLHVFGHRDAEQRIKSMMDRGISYRDEAIDALVDSTDYFSMVETDVNEKIMKENL